MKPPGATTWGLTVRSAGQAVGREVGNKTAGGDLRNFGLVRPGEGDGLFGGGEMAQIVAVSHRDGPGRDRDRGIALNGCVDGTGDVVVDDDTGCTGFLSGSSLLMECRSAVNDNNLAPCILDRDSARLGTCRVGNDLVFGVVGRRVRSTRRGRVGNVLVVDDEHRCLGGNVVDGTNRK